MNYKTCTYARCSSVRIKHIYTHVQLNSSNSSVSISRENLKTAWPTWKTSVVLQEHTTQNYVNPTVEIMRKFRSSPRTETLPFRHPTKLYFCPMQGQSFAWNYTPGIDVLRTSIGCGRLEILKPPPVALLRWDSPSLSTAAGARVQIPPRRPRARSDFVWLEGGVGQGKKVKVLTKWPL